MYRIYLKKNEEKRLLGGESWVYANEAAKTESDEGTKNGDLGAVYSSDGRFLGKGRVNHLSKILVRIFLYGEDDVPDYNFYLRTIKKADDYRRRLGYDNCYRAVFAESDGLPGLIVDKYGDLLSVQILTLGMETDRELILDALTEIYKPRGIYERSDAEVRKKEGLALRTGILRGDFDPVTVIEENGVKVIADLENGQKTGYFLDQKENRLAVRRYSKGADVLDCFCNAGGFSLNAAAGGAKSVVAADISEKALADVRRAAELNGFENIIKTECCDVFELLRRYKAEGRQFDTVILDPPAFCKSASDVPNALRGYRDINILGMKLVRPGGFLVSASCTHFVTMPMFENMLREAARASGKTVRVSEIKTQAPDHPACFSAQESAYLKFYVLNLLS